MPLAMGVKPAPRARRGRPGWGMAQPPVSASTPTSAPPNNSPSCEASHQIASPNRLIG